MFINSLFWLELFLSLQKAKIVLISVQVVRHWEWFWHLYQSTWDSLLQTLPRSCHPKIWFNFHLFKSYFWKQPSGSPCTTWSYNQVLLYDHIKPKHLINISVSTERISISSTKQTALGIQVPTGVIHHPPPYSQNQSGTKNGQLLLKVSFKCLR